MVTLTKTDGWVRMRYHSNFTVQNFCNDVGTKDALQFLMTRELHI